MLLYGQGKRFCLKKITFNTVQFMTPYTFDPRVLANTSLMSLFFLWLSGQAGPYAVHRQCLHLLWYRSHLILEFSLRLMQLKGFVAEIK